MRLHDHRPPLVLGPLTRRAWRVLLAEARELCHLPAGLRYGGKV